MNIVGYSAARQRLAKLMDSVVDDRRPVVVTRRKAPAVVMLALDEVIFPLHRCGSSGGRRIVCR
jgi:prevent-host-death family protein